MRLGGGGCAARRMARHGEAWSGGFGAFSSRIPFAAPKHGFAGYRIIPVTTLSTVKGQPWGSKPGLRVQTREPEEAAPHYEFQRFTVVGHCAGARYRRPTGACFRQRMFPKVSSTLLEHRRETKGVDLDQGLWNQSLSRADRRWNQRLS